MCMVPDSTRDLGRFYKTRVCCLVNGHLKMGTRPGPPTLGAGPTSEPGCCGLLFCAVTGLLPVSLSVVAVCQRVREIVAMQTCQK